MDSSPVTVPVLRAMKSRGERIAMVTAYDATFARMFDEAGVDAAGRRQLGMVVQGLDSTLPVTVDEIVYHCRAVARGTRRAHIVADMPFMSWQISVEEALRNAARFLSRGRRALGQARRRRAARRRPSSASSTPASRWWATSACSRRACTPWVDSAFRVKHRRRGRRACCDDARAVAEAGAFRSCSKASRATSPRVSRPTISDPHDRHRRRRRVRWPGSRLLRPPRPDAHAPQVREALRRDVRRGQTRGGDVL
jgi:hypothetical protein